MSETQNDSTPWFIDEAGPESRKHAPATLRNRQAIADVLGDYLPRTGTVLELASGSGEHVVHFAAQFPDLRWQPSDMNAEACRSIAAWTAQEALENVAPPLLIDVCDDSWPIKRADAVLCINMVHIAPWAATLAVFQRCRDLLESGTMLYFYGPYMRQDVATSQSNMDFDRSLRSRNPEWGLRDVADMDRGATDNGFDRKALVEMPANNLSLVYRRH